MDVIINYFHETKDCFDGRYFDSRFFFSHMTVIDGKRIFNDFIIIYYESNLNGWTICELEILEDHKQR